MRLTRRAERGASLVEVGIIMPMLIVLSIGLAEIGFLVIDYITVTNAARSGARTGAAAADDPNADQFILNVVEEDFDVVTHLNGRRLSEFVKRNHAL